MKTILESIRNRKSTGNENPCIDFAGEFEHDDIEFVLYHISDKEGEPIYNAFFWNTGLNDAHKKWEAIGVMEDFIWEIYREGIKFNLDNGLSKQASASITREKIRDDIAEDDFFFERCPKLTKYIKDKNLRCNLLNNFRILLGIDQS